MILLKECRFKPLGRRLTRNFRSISRSFAISPSFRPAIFAVKSCLHPVFTAGASMLARAAATRLATTASGPCPLGLTGAGYKPTTTLRKDGELMPISAMASTARGFKVPASKPALFAQECIQFSLNLVGTTPKILRPSEPAMPLL